MFQSLHLHLVGLHLSLKKNLFSTPQIHPSLFLDLLLTIYLLDLHLIFLSVSLPYRLLLLPTKRLCS